MSQTLLYRIAAVALVVGAVLVTVGNLLAPQGDARAAVESSLYSPMALVVLAAASFVLGRLQASTEPTPTAGASRRGSRQMKLTSRGRSMRKNGRVPFTMKSISRRMKSSDLYM